MWAIGHCGTQVGMEVIKEFENHCNPNLKMETSL